jgi:hypothetical protein
MMFFELRHVYRLSAPSYLVVVAKAYRYAGRDEQRLVKLGNSTKILCG